VSSATHLERTATGTTITNSSTNASTTTTPSTDATRAKYDGMASDFAAQKGGTHTLQFELVCETASITRALSEGGGKVWFVRTRYRSRPCYRVFWGRFDSSAAANAASKELPASLGSAPVVVKIPR
jgi:septal ring-binding cell division protein DamX